ncbi:hypothetical protein D3C75_1323170 [compost metagenome]
MDFTSSVVRISCGPVLGSTLIMAALPEGLGIIGLTLATPFSFSINAVDLAISA